MIWDVDSYIVLGDDDHGFTPSGSDLIPEPWRLEKLNAKWERQKAYEKRRLEKRGAQS